MRRKFAAYGAMIASALHVAESLRDSDVSLGETDRRGARLPLKCRKRAAQY